MIRDRTDEELKQLAKDMHAGRVFTNQHVSDAHDVALVFLPLAAMDPSQLHLLERDDPGLIYEYLTEALPRMVNNMPVFGSMHLLSKGDRDKLFELIKKLEDAEQAALAE